MAKSRAEKLTDRSSDLGDKLEAARKRGAIAGANDMFALLPELMRLLSDMAFHLEQLDYVVNQLTYPDDEDEDEDEDG